MMIRNIGSKRELFIDDWLIDHMDNTAFKLHSPMPEEVSIENDSGDIAYVTVFKDDKLYRMYYRGHGSLKLDQLTCYAESRDGVNWYKPDLGLIEFEGNRQNNIVWDGAGTAPRSPSGVPASAEKQKWAWSLCLENGRELPPDIARYSPEEQELIRGVCAFARGGLPSSSHNFTPFVDGNPAAPPEQRYKAVGGTCDAGLIGMYSADGINWRAVSDEPIIKKGKFDSQNIVLWNPLRKEYVAFLRTLLNDKYRSFSRCTSSDFLHWSEPEQVGLGGVQDEHLYTSAATQYIRAPHLYLAFPRRFVEKNTVMSDYDSISDQIFMTSRDGGKNWNRNFMEAFIRPGVDPKNWTDRNGTVSNGVVITGQNELSLYWVEHLHYPSCRVRRGSLRLDGFASVNAPYQGGGFITRPFTFSGSRLSLNYATSAAGSVQVEIQDGGGRTIEGYGLNQEMCGDLTDSTVAWEAGSRLDKLIGKTIRLRFVMKDADIYALQFID